MITVVSFGSYCNKPKECEIEPYTEWNNKKKSLRCLLTDKTQLRFNKFINETQKKCDNFSEIVRIILRPRRERSMNFEKEMIDLKDISSFLEITERFITIEIQYFKGFELNVSEISIDNDKFWQTNSISFTFSQNIFDFYFGKRKLNSCQDFINETNSTNPKSIIQLVSRLNINQIHLYLSEPRNICPLVFKNSNINDLTIVGENSYFSSVGLSFSNHSYQDLNSSIYLLNLRVTNIELDLNFLHPDVFKNVETLYINEQPKKIHPDLFFKLNEISDIYIYTQYLKSILHDSGIDWIKNINKDVYCDLENSEQLKQLLSQGKRKRIYFDCNYNPSFYAFPNEDFCLYKDFPINQLVVILEYCNEDELQNNTNKNFSCTYLWITRSYKYFINHAINPNHKVIMNWLLNSDDYKSISKCDFDKRLEICNKTIFTTQHITTAFDHSENIKLAEIIINILSYILSIFGIVTNLLIIITISSKKNKEDFKGYKHYSYLRLNSIFSCLILLIHLFSWLNQCIYPFQVFCPLIRKTVFMQYFKIIIGEVLMTTLKFMNNFTYIGFAFNRISLIGKDHNKLVKFMSDLGIKTYIGVTLFISIGLSVIKFFEYRINIGSTLNDYPFFHEFVQQFADNIEAQVKPFLVIFAFISDLFNYFVFLIVNFSIDIGMIIKLRKTLKEKLEKSKEYSSKEQQEKKRKENEKAFNNARSIVIWNISLNIIFKLPAISYSINYLYMRKNRISICSNNCISLLLKFSDFFYFLYISIQFFFYIHYDKNFKKKFYFKKV